MSCSSKVSRTFERENPSKSLRAAEKSQGAAEKKEKRLDSRVLWFSVSRNVLFYQENKNSNVDNFIPRLDKNPPTSS